LTALSFVLAPTGYTDLAFVIGNQGFNFAGPQLFEGTLENPQMLAAGDFSLKGLGEFGSFGNFELSANLGSPAPVPEPPAWTMMISGLAILGIVRRLARAPRTTNAAGMTASGAAPASTP